MNVQFGAARVFYHTFKDRDAVVLSLYPDDRYPDDMLTLSQSRHEAPPVSTALDAFPEERFLGRSAYPAQESFYGKGLETGDTQHVLLAPKGAIDKMPNDLTALRSLASKLTKGHQSGARQWLTTLLTDMQAREGQDGTLLVEPKAQMLKALADPKTSFQYLWNGALTGDAKSSDGHLKLFFVLPKKNEGALESAEAGAPEKNEEPPAKTEDAPPKQSSLKDFLDEMDELLERRARGDLGGFFSWR